MGENEPKWKRSFWWPPVDLCIACGLQHILFLSVRYIYVYWYRATYRTDSMMLQKLEFAQSCRNSNLENRCSMKLCFHCGGKRKRFTAVYIFVILNTTDEQSDEQYQTMIAPNSVNSLYMFRTVLGFGLSIIFLWMFLGPLPDFWQGIVHVHCWINVLDTAGREAINRYLWCCTCLWEALWS